MNLLTMFSTSHCISYRKQLNARMADLDDKLSDATRGVLHAANKTLPDDRNIFDELAEGLERRRHARTFSN